jgi:hypothetical protein
MVMMKRLEIDGRIVTVYPKKIEVNGEEVVTQGEVLIELQPDVWAQDPVEPDSYAAPVGDGVPASRTGQEEAQPG